MTPPSDTSKSLWPVGLVVGLVVIGIVIALLPSSGEAPTADVGAAEAPTETPAAEPPETPAPTAPAAAPPSAKTSNSQLPPSQRTLPALSRNTQEKLNAAMEQADAMTFVISELLTDLERAKGDEEALRALMARFNTHNKEMTATVEKILAGVSEAGRFHFETYVKSTLGPLASTLIHQLMNELEMEQEVSDDGKVRYKGFVPAESLPPEMQVAEDPAPAPSAPAAPAPATPPPTP